MSRLAKQLPSKKPPFAWWQRFVSRMRFLLADFISQSIDRYQMTPTEIQFAELSDEAHWKVKIFMDHLAKDNPHPQAVSKSQQAAVDAWRKMQAFPASLRSK